MDTLLKLIYTFLKTLKLVLVELFFLKSFRGGLSALISFFTRKILLSRKSGFLGWIQLTVVAIVLAIFSFVVVVLVSSTYKVLALEYMPPSIYFALCYIVYGKTMAQAMVVEHYYTASEAMTRISTDVVQLVVASTPTSWTSLILPAMVTVCVLSSIWLWKAHCAATVSAKIARDIQADALVKTRSDVFEDEVCRHFRAYNQKINESFCVKAYKELDSIPHNRVPFVGSYLKWRKAQEDAVMTKVDQMILEQARRYTQAASNAVREMQVITDKCFPAYGGKSDFGSHKMCKLLQEGIAYDAGIAVTEAINASIDRTCSALTGLERWFYVSECAVTGVVAAINGEDAAFMAVDHVHRDLINLGLSLVIGVCTFFGAGFVINHTPAISFSFLNGSNVAVAVAQTDAYLGLANQGILHSVYEYMLPPLIWLLEHVNKVVNVQSYLDKLLIITCTPDDIGLLKQSLTTNSTLLSQPYDKVVQELVQQKNASIPVVSKK